MAQAEKAPKETLEIKDKPVKIPEGIPITLAFLHTGVTWPGCILGERTLSDTKVKGIKMELLPNDLVLYCKGRRAFVPKANVIIAIE